MTVIRTVVVTLPRIISDIVEQLLTDRTELRICARLDTRAALEDSLRMILPGLVLIGLAPGESPAIGASVSAIVPDATVIAFSSDGCSAHVTARGISLAPIIPPTADAIISVIRGIELTDLDPRREI